MRRNERTSLAQDSVLILTSNTSVAEEIVTFWRAQRWFPSFTVAGHDWAKSDTATPYSLILVATAPKGNGPGVLTQLQESLVPVLVVCDEDRQAENIAATFPLFTTMRKRQDWLETLVMIGSEMLKRGAAQQRAVHSEEQSNAQKRFSALGKCMLEMRHDFNNCLTSVLGNAELLLLQSDRLRPEGRDQLETIHAMAMRMHEMMQRFSSLESELHFAERASQAETRSVMHQVASGNGA